MLKHDGTPIVFTLMWHQIGSFASNVLIFWSSQNRTRQYHRYFRDRVIAYYQQIYRNLANETLGDVCSLSALLLSYLDKVIVLNDDEIERLCTNADILCFDETVHGERLFRVFDNMCRRRLASTICCFNNYNKPIVDLSTIDVIVATTALVFLSYRNACAACEG